MSDPLRMNLISLADRLHMTIAEAEEMTLSELNEWSAYFKILKDKNG